MLVTADMNVSLDGFVAGPNHGQHNPLGRLACADVIQTAGAVHYTFEREAA